VTMLVERTNGKPPAGTSASVVQATGKGRSLDRVLERTSYRLFRQLYLNIPAMGRGISILTALAGEPAVQGVDEEHTLDLQTWTEDVKAGWGGMGLGCFLGDHGGQMLLHGNGVAEAEIGPFRDEVTGLWSYRSEYFRYDTDRGQLDIRQLNARDGPGSSLVSGGRVLSPLTATVSTFDPQGSAPEGQPLYLACPTVAQVWVETLMAFKSTMRRMGIPIFHINGQYPENWEDDAEFTRATALATQMSNGLNEAVKSQVEQGLAKDWVTLGNVTVKVLGLDGEAMDFQISKRQLIEEIVVASDVPPSLFGYSWSATERMSSVQMRKLSGRVRAIRRALNPCIRKMLDLRQRVRGESRPYTLMWPDTNLAEELETARAALNDANADVKKLQYALALWRLGIWDQTQVAEYCTGSAEVKRALAEPPAVSLGGGDGSSGDGSSGQDQDEADSTVGSN